VIVNEQYTTSKSETTTNFTLDADREEIRQTFGKAFAGTEKIKGEPFFEWFLSQYKFPSEEDREQFFRYMMSYPLFEDLSCNSFFLSLRNSDGNIMSVVSVQEFDPVIRSAKESSFLGKLQKNWRSVKTMMKFIAETPELFKSKEDRRIFVEKTKKFEDDATKWQIQYGPNNKHWYVHVVACNPEFQGQGNGRALMTKLCEMADQMGQDMYLEAGETNRPFYEKFGFVVKHTEPFYDPHNFDAEPFQLQLMARETKPTDQRTNNNRDQ
jgi:ribosomal protein S18 acetylase RimI-like enzyme